MKHAVDTQTNEFVHARNAVRDRYRYRCPHCGNRVIRAGGFLQVTHFRHTFASFASDCPDYHAGTVAQLATTRSDAEPALQLSAVADLFLSCKGTARRSGWRLTLFVPNPSGRYEWCQFEDSRGRRPRHFAKWAKASGWRLSVMPQNSAYRVDCGRENTSSTIWIPGLEAGLNVFAASPYDGRRLDEQSPIVAGRQYALVTTDDNSALHVEGISFQNLPRHDAWNASLFQLQAPVPQAARSWVSRVLGRAVELPQANLAVLLPPRWSEPFSDGCLIRPALVTLAAQSGCDVPSSLVISDGDQQAALLNPLESKPVAFASFQVRADSSYVVFAAGWKSDRNRRPLTRHLPQPLRSRGIVRSAIVLRLRYGEDSETVAASLLEPVSNDRLADLCSQRAVLVGIEAPFPTPIEIETPNHRCRIVPSASNAKSPEHFCASVADELRKAIDSGTKWMRLDAGAFGTIECGSLTASVHDATERRLPATTNRRLKWTLLSAAAAPEAILSVSQARALIEKLDSGHITHGELLATLRKLTFSAPRVSAHSRALYRTVVRHRHAHRDIT